MSSSSKLWICIFLPALTLQAVAMMHDEASVLIEVPLVIADGPQSRPMVYACNRAARACGVSVGMTIASAKVLHHALVALPRQHAREQRLLSRIARALLAYTPSVVIDEDLDRANIAIDIFASRTLFGGFDALHARVCATLARLRIHARTGVAPTLPAAQLLARSGQGRCQTLESVRATLSPIAIIHAPWPQATINTLHTLGLTTFGDVLRQPQAGLQKRFGSAFVHDLDCALGLAQKVYPYYTPPTTFESRIDFLFEIKDADLLLMPIEQLLVEMEGFLSLRSAGVSNIVLLLQQGRSQSQTLAFQSRAPLRRTEQWLELVRDRLQHITLDDPVNEITLSAPQIVSLTQANASLLPQEKGSASDWITLLNRLSSKLGAHNLYRIEAQDDHRPELAWRVNAETIAPQRFMAVHKVRPTLLLRAPKSLIEMEGAPQFHGPLRLLAGPERIDTGWWDNRPVTRDYYVAINPAREVCWIFRDYRQGKRWYLHGFFS